MRSTSAGVAVLILGGAAFFWWQRSQIVTLREQVYALEASQKRVADPSPLLMAAADPRMGGPVAQAFRVGASRSRRSDDSAVLRADERRLILSQYRDVLAEVKLPPATAAHLEDLLMERIEVVLDAEDAAVREGFAEGSAEMAQAVTLAIADLNREIAVLVGIEGERRLNWPSAPPQPEPAVSPEPAAPANVVNVVVQTQPAPYYSDTSAQPAVSEVSTPYAPYYYYPFTSFFVSRSTGRPFGGVRSGVRPGAGRPFHPGAGGGARVAMRRR